MKYRYPVAGAITIVLICVFEVLFLVKTEPLTGRPILQPTADDAVVVAKKMLYSEVKGSIAILGDSSAFHGLQPSILNVHSSENFVNLATLASMTVLGYCHMGVELLEQDEPPKAILLSVLPQTIEINKEKARQMGQLSRYLVAYGKDDLIDYELTLRDYLQWFSKKHRFNIFPPEFGGSFDNFLNEVRRNGGFLVESKDSIYRGNKLTDFQPSKLSISALEWFIKAAEDKNIPVYLVLNPKPDTLVSDAYLNDVSKFVSRLQGSSKNLFLVDNELLSLDESYFGTETHLNEEGASLYSMHIAKQLSIHSY